MVTNTSYGCLLANNGFVLLQNVISHQGMHDCNRQLYYVQAQAPIQVGSFTLFWATAVSACNSVADLEFWKGGFQYSRVYKAREVHLLGGSWGMLPQENFAFLTWDRFWCIFGVKLQKFDDLLLNLVVVLEACRIKGVTPFRLQSSGYPRKARENSLIAYPHY